MMLDRYTAAEVRSVEQVEGWLQSDYPGARCRTSAEREFSYRVNAARLPRIGLVFSSCTTASEATLPPASFVRQIFPLQKPGQLVVGHRFSCDVLSTGCVIPPDEVMLISHREDYQQLAVRIDPGILHAALSNLMGSQTRPLEFAFASEKANQQAHFLRQAAITIAEEINFFGPDMDVAAVAELEQSLIFRFLLYTHHNYSEVLLKTPPATSANAVERAETYIRANWSEPLNFEVLSCVTDTSVRSLFRSFRQMRNYSPSEYVKQVRLDHARNMIQREDDASIMSIALRCGFHNIGRFAQEYRARFGELPSTTRRRK